VRGVCPPSVTSLIDNGPCPSCITLRRFFPRLVSSHSIPICLPTFVGHKSRGPIVTSGMCSPAPQMANIVTHVANVYSYIYGLFNHALASHSSVSTNFASLVLTTRDQIPWWLLVSFGSYSLWSLGWGLYTFKDCPEAYTELLGVSPQREMLTFYIFCFGLFHPASFWEMTPGDEVGLEFSSQLSPCK
jgi:dolichyl-phosphate mannosyltransferase polypeptide 3